MAVRASMSALIARVRLMIGDPSGTSQQFVDQQIQDELDYNRQDVRYESMQVAPSIVNINNTGFTAQTIFADYYSKFTDWEADCVIQGQGATGLPWVVLTPLASDLIVGHFQFELDVFNTGTVPGQMPPLFITGKIFDPAASAASLLDFWSATLASAYDFTSDGQTFHRSQLMTAKKSMADYFRRRAKPKMTKMERNDVMADLSTTKMRLLDSPDIVKGA
jgi:hypothetical protein